MFIIKNAGKLAIKIADKVLKTDAFSEIAKSSGAVIGKAVDQHLDSRKELIEVPNVIELKVSEAKAYLEKIGFEVHVILDKPKNKYKDLSENQVVNMIPKSGKVKQGSLIKLYFVNQGVINSSRKTRELPNVVGMPLERAVLLLEEAGFLVAPVLMMPKKENVKKQVGQVIKMTPTPSLTSKHFKKGNIIRLNYVDEAVMQESKELLQAHRQKLIKQSDRISGTLIKAKGKLIPKRKKR